MALHRECRHVNFSRVFLHWAAVKRVGKMVWLARGGFGSVTVSEESEDVESR